MDDLIKLTFQQRSQLATVVVAKPQPKQFQRAQALLLLDEGNTVAEVADLLHVSRQTIYNWLTWFQGRPQVAIPTRLLDAPRSGRPPTVTGVIDPLLDVVIDSDPRDFGYRSTVWTAALLRRYLADYHQMPVSQRSVSYALERLAIIWKRPRYSLARQSPTWRQAKGA